MIRKIPAALTIAALLLGALALVASRRGDSDAVRDATTRSARGASVSTTIKSPEAQVAFWQARVDANPGDYLSRTSLGSSMLALAKTTGNLDLYPQAETVFAVALQQNPRHPAALLGLGAARGAQHDFAAQLALAEHVLAQDERNESARVAAADARLELGDVDAAHAVYEDLARGRRSAAISSRLAKTAWLRGDGDGAVALSEEAIDLSSELELAPEQAAYYFFQLATFSYRNGDVTRARTAIDRAVEIDPHGLGALELAPRISVAEGDLDAATKGYEALLAVSPAADLHGELAELYAVAGRTEEAQRQVDLGLALGREQVGRYPAERRHLAGFFGAYDPELALTLAEEDVEMRRDFGAYDTLAWALHQNGRNGEALGAIRQALATGVQDAEVYFHAGVIALEAGDVGRAREWLGRALDINPRFDVVDARIASDALDRLR